MTFLHTGLEFLFYHDSDISGRDSEERLGKYIVYLYVFPLLLPSPNLTRCFRDQNHLGGASLLEYWYDLGNNTVQNSSHNTIYYSCKPPIYRISKATWNETSEKLKLFFRQRHDFCLFVWIFFFLPGMTPLEIVKKKGPV